MNELSIIPNVMIKVLKNSFTKEYIRLKDIALNARDLPWFYHSTTTDNEPYETNKIDSVNIPFYSHSIIVRPEDDKKYPLVTSINVDLACEVVQQILDENNIHINSFLRMNLNAVEPQQKIVSSVPHVDHPFPHKNFLIYFTNAGGKTYLGNESHDPKEDDVIFFESNHLEDQQYYHWHDTPKEKRRVALVATFI